MRLPPGTKPNTPSWKGRIIVSMHMSTTQEALDTSSTDCSATSAKGKVCALLCTTHLETSNLEVLLGGVGDSLLDL